MVRVIQGGGLQASRGLGVQDNEGFVPYCWAKQRWLGIPRVAEALHHCGYLGQLGFTPCHTALLGQAGWLLLHIAHQFLAYQKAPKPWCVKQPQSCTVLGLLATSQGTVQGSQELWWGGMCGIGSREELKGEGEPYLRTGICNYFSQGVTWETGTVSLYLQKKKVKISNFQVWNTQMQKIYHSYLVVLDFLNCGLC